MKGYRPAVMSRGSSEALVQGPSGCEDLAIPRYNGSSMFESSRCIEEAE